jgi:hypothetical protein
MRSIHRIVKIAIWRGFPGKKASNTAPVLEFEFPQAADISERTPP